MPNLKIAFYNVENLFDRETASRDPALMNKIRDELRDWTPSIRDKKLRRIGRVIRSLNPDLLGISEIENEHVLKRLAWAADRDRYGVVGHPSPDKRGIDVCFLYDQSKLDVIEGGFNAVAIGFNTRDLVWARFEILNTSQTFIAVVSHWPSRGGNDDRARKAVGKKIHELFLFLRKAYGSDIPILVMGDFNDEPNDPSVKNSLRARDRHSAWQDTSGETLFNASASAVSNSIRGTYNFRGDWLTLDHITLSRNLLDQNSSIKFIDNSENIFAPQWVRKSNGRPRRFGRPASRLDEGGFSDHFAVSIELEV